MKPDEIHEAAHAVIAYRLGRGVKWITVDPFTNPHGHPGGTAFAPWPDPMDQHTRGERDIIIAVAGGIAQTFAADGDHALIAHAERSSLLDMQQALGRAKFLWPDADECKKQFTRLIREAERLIDQHWQDIDRVADLLLSRRSLTGADLVGLLHSP